LTSHRAPGRRDELTERLGRCYTGAVHDVLRMMGHERCVLPLGDRDGVVIVPGRLVEEAVARTEAVVATESEMRRALIGGMDPVDAYHKFGKF
jgi:hypothetical protein